MTIDGSLLLQEEREKKGRLAAFIPDVTSPKKNLKKRLIVTPH
jgi:hypothetical protein